MAKKLTTLKNRSLSNAKRDSVSVAAILSDVNHIREGIAKNRYEGFIKGYEQAVKDIMENLGSITGDL